MPDSNQPVVFSCPNCGSSVALEGQRGLCAYCGTAIERPSRIRRPGTHAWPPTLNAVPRAVRADGGGSRRGVRLFAVLVLILLALGAGFAAGRLVPSGKAAPQAGPAPTKPPVVQLDAGSVSDLAAVLPIDGPGGDPLVYLYHNGENDQTFYTLARIDGATRETRWQSQPLGKNAYQGLLVVGQDLIYLTDGDRLLALSLRDGTTAWQAALEVEPQVACDGCLRLAVERVLVLEKNGGLQAFDARSGQMAWSARLEDTPRRLPVVGRDRLLAIRDSADDRGRLLAFIDTTNGRTALEIDPRCPRPHDNFDEERPGVDTPFPIRRSWSPRSTATRPASRAAACAPIPQAARRPARRKIHPAPAPTCSEPQSRPR